jgi:hypothetical protein
MYWPSMFQRIYDFGYQRRGLEVMGFFITYMIGIVIGGAIVGSIVAALFGGDAARVNWKIDLITHSIILLIITHLIVRQKQLYVKSQFFMFLPLATSILAQFVGPAISLIIPTFLSSLPKATTFTPPPTSGNYGANEQTVKEQQNQPPPAPPTQN